MPDDEQELEQMAGDLAVQSKRYKKTEEMSSTPYVTKEKSPERGYHSSSEVEPHTVRLGETSEIIDVPMKRKGIVDSVIGAKAGLSETKLKFMASHVGIGEAEFEKMQREGRLNEVYKAVEAGKERELYQDKQRALRDRYEAGTRNIESITEKRDYQASVPDGGKRPIFFGSNDYGRSKIMVANRGEHHSIRERYTPQSSTGVANSIANSRAAMARLQQSVLSRPSVAYTGAASSPVIRKSPNSWGDVRVVMPSFLPGVPQSVSALQPNRGQPFGNNRMVPSAVSRLGTPMGTGAPALSRLSPNGRAPSTGGNILSRLSPKRFRK